MKKANISIIVAIITTLLLLGCVTVKTVNDNNKTFSPGAPPTIIIVAGESETIRDQMKVLKNTFPGSELVISKEFFSFNSAEEDVLRQIRDRGILGPLVLIGYSGFGKVVREIDAKNPGLVVAIVTFGTALGKLRFIPEFISNIALRPDDAYSKTPLLVVGGFVKNDTDDHWWVADKNRSDGVVDIASVTDLGNRQAELAVFEGLEHYMLLEDPKVMNKIKIWLRPYLEPK